LILLVHIALISNLLSYNNDPFRICILIPLLTLVSLMFVNNSNLLVLRFVLVLVFVLVETVLLGVVLRYDPRCPALSRLQHSNNNHALLQLFRICQFLRLRV
jgi:FtsH-binding integral membrane protein